MFDLEVWDEMRAMERRVDDLFRAFLGPRARTWFQAVPTTFHRPFIPATDVFVKDGTFFVRLELPGVDPVKDVTLLVRDGELIVRGERKQTEKIKEESFYRMETCYGAFERHIPVPEGTEEKKVKAEYKNGVLEITLPAVSKALEPPQAKTIPIKTAA